MKLLRSLIPLCAVVALMASGIPAAAVAQTVGADDYDAPEDDAPGDPAPAAPTGDSPGEPGRTDGAAVHPVDETPQRTESADVDFEPGDTTLEVELTHATDDGADLEQMSVVLEAVLPGSPLQPDGSERVVSTWEASTDADATASFDELPDELTERGLLVRASTHFGGLAYETELTSLQPGSSLELTVYDQTHSYPGVRISEKRVLVSPWEEYLIFDQYWTLELQGDHAFDITNSNLEDGLPLRVPFRAEGISATGPGQLEVVDNIVYFHGVLQPDRPTTVQIRFSKPVHVSSFTFEQTMDYPVDEISILAAVDTDFQKMPRLDDLALRAPGFEVSNDPTDAGLPPHTTRDFLVATGLSVDRDESYTFRLEGLPFSRPFGAWITLAAGVLGALFVAMYGRREYQRMRQAENDDEALAALNRRRDDLLDELTWLEDEIDRIDDEDTIVELEQDRMLIRQRLALIMGKIEELTGSASTDTDAA